MSVSGFFFCQGGRSNKTRRKLRTDESGAVAIIFAFLIIPLLIFVGGAVDIARMLETRNRAQAAIDAALLSAARTMQTSNGNRTEALRIAALTYKVAMSNGRRLLHDDVTFVISSSGTKFYATGSATIGTQFLRVANISKLAVLNLSAGNSNEVTIASGADANQDMEVAMMLDITGSMTGRRLEDLKASARDLVNIIVGSSQSSHKSRNALVPYAAGVNAGTYGVEVRGSFKKGTCSSPGCQNYSFVSTLGLQQTLPSTNCVSERTGASAFDDTSPSTAKVGYAYLEAANVCPSEAVTPLTANKDQLIAAIDRLKAGGSTGAQVGFAWSWYVLSPKWVYVWPMSTPDAYDSSAVKKIAVLMTDGEFNSPYCKGAIARDATLGSGSTSAHINCNAPNGSSYAQALKLCTGMKKAGIEIFTVGFDVIDTGEAKRVMSECASDPSNAYNAVDGEQLRGVFRDIGLKISTVYLSR